MAASTRAHRASAFSSKARSAGPSTDRCRSPRSLSRGSGCGRCARWTRPSNGSSARRSTPAPTRSVRSSRPRACRGALAIDPRKANALEGPGGGKASVIEAHRTIEAIWRIESARLIAGLARLVGDIGTAEERAQDALVAALEQWPTSGVPEKPGAWLIATAKHRAIDAVRRRQTLERKREEMGRDVERAQEGIDPNAAIDEDVGDDLLGLIFMACHPVLSRDARVALTLRVLGGLRTEEIARGFLVPVSSIAQRIVRAKRTLTEAHVTFEVPGGPERAARLASVLEVLYLIFNEGYAATAAETDWPRIVALYDAVAQLAPSPVVELNRAVAVGMAFGPAAGLDIVDALVAEPSLKAYHLLPAVRGDFLRKLGRFQEARAEFERAASLTENVVERKLLERRAAECAAEGMAG